MGADLFLSHMDMSDANNTLLGTLQENYGMLYEKIILNQYTIY